MIKYIESGIGGKGLNKYYVSSINKLGSNFNLKCSVSTKNDGSIKVEAEGEEDNLIKFSKKLSKGSFYSSVENFYIKWS
jgi:acylphosphatase